MDAFEDPSHAVIADFFDIFIGQPCSVSFRPECVEKTSADSILNLSPNSVSRRKLFNCGIIHTIAEWGHPTLLSDVEAIVGRHNITQLRTKHLADRFELFSFVGKSLLIGQDVAGDFLNTEGAHVIKALSGGDLLEAERKNGGKVQLTGNFNILVKTNARLWLKLDGDAGAWERRLLIIEFTKKRSAKPAKRNLCRIRWFLDQNSPTIWDSTAVNETATQSHLSTARNSRVARRGFGVDCAIGLWGEHLGIHRQKHSSDRYPIEWRHCHGGHFIGDHRY